LRDTVAIKRTPLYTDKLFLVEDNSSRWVEYSRSPGTRYEYLEIGDAERRILNGETIRRAFVPGIAAEGFSRIMTDAGERERDSVRVEGESLTICVPIVIRESIILVTALQGMTLDPTHGDMSLDASFHPEMDVVPNHFLSAVNCTGTRFQGAVNAAGAEFSNLIFFEETMFGDVADFTGAVFFHTAVFKGSRFIKGASFDRTTFHRAAQFGGVDFREKTSFDDSVFFDNTFFANTRFSEDMQMVGAHFGRMLYAPGSVFEKGALFDRSCFCLAVEMKNAEFGGDLSMNGAQGNIMSLAEARSAGSVRIVDTPFSILDFTDARCARDVVLFGNQWEKTIEDIGEVVTGYRKSQTMETSGDMSSDTQSGRKDERLRWAARRADEVEALSVMHRDRGRIVDLVGLEGISVKGCFRCDFSYLAPSSREFPVLDSHRRALKNKDPEGSEENRAAWRRAEREYAWLADRYKSQGIPEDEEAARLWQSECRIRGLSGLKKRLFMLHRKNVNRRKERAKKRSTDTEKKRKNTEIPGSDDD